MKNDKIYSEAGSPAGKEISERNRYMRALVVIIALCMIGIATIMGFVGNNIAMGLFLMGGVFLLWIVILSL